VHVREFGWRLGVRDVRCCGRWMGVRNLHGAKSGAGAAV
jgi:hypothetical protein